MRKLDRYIIRSILGSTLLVMSALLVLGALFVFIEQQDDIGVGRYTIVSAVSYTLMNLPQQVYELLPVTVIIGSLIGLGSLARGSELTVIRATGISVLRIAGTALMAAGLLIALEVLLGEFLAPPMQEAAKEQKAFSKSSNISIGGGDAWVRDGNLILHVAGQSGGRQFGGMQVFELSADRKLCTSSVDSSDRPVHPVPRCVLAVGHAVRATAGAKRNWMLGDYTESRFAQDSVTNAPSKERALTSNVTASFLGLAVANPGQLTSRSLWKLIQYLQANELDSREYVFAFWSRIARTTAIAFAVLLAIPFVLGSLRSSGAGTRTMIGFLLGLGFFLLQRLIESGTIVFALNPIVLAWVPTTLLALVSLTLLARATR